MVRSLIRPFIGNSCSSIEADGIHPVGRCSPAGQVLELFHYHLFGFGNGEDCKEEGINPRELVQTR